MNLSSFDYHLPNELIALRPSRPRDSSRLLVVNKRTKEISNTIFKNIDAVSYTHLTMPTKA